MVTNAVELDLELGGRIVVGVGDNDCAARGFEEADLALADGFISNKNEVIEGVIVRDVGVDVSDEDFVTLRPIEVYYDVAIVRADASVVEDLAIDVEIVELELIGARVAGQGVAALVAREAVVARSAKQTVVTASTTQFVVVQATIQGVVAPGADQHIVAGNCIQTAAASR